MNLAASRLMGWDWVLLANLAAEKADLASDGALSALERDVNLVKQQMASGALTEAAIAKFPTTAREAMLFVVSRGRGDTYDHKADPATEFHESQSIENPISVTRKISFWAASSFMRAMDTAFIGYLKDGLAAFVRFVVRLIAS